jgi:hypothetical protein
MFIVDEFAKHLHQRQAGNRKVVAAQAQQRRAQCSGDK